MNRTRKKMKKKGGGVGSSRLKKDTVEKETDTVKKEKKVVFNSAENEYYPDMLQDSDEIIRFKKKDKKSRNEAYLDEAEEINENINNKNRKREITNEKIEKLEKQGIRHKTEKKKILKLINPSNYATRKKDESIENSKIKKKKNETIRKRENPRYHELAKQRREAEEFKKNIFEFMELKKT
jgi:hypothetical protein